VSVPLHRAQLPGQATPEAVQRRWPQRYAGERFVR
jgi:hypothetical protein